MDSAAAELAKAGPPRVANSDAVALAAYLQALGLNIDADRVNKLLALLVVLVIECGGGFSLAVGMSLSAMPGTDTSRRTHEGRMPVDTAAGHKAAPVRVGQTKAVSSCPPTPDSRDSLGMSGVRLLKYISGHGGVLSGGQRGMARAIGWSKSRLHEALHELARAGMVHLQTDKTGTVVQLLAS